MLFAEIHIEYEADILNVIENRLIFIEIHVHDFHNK